MQAVFWIIVGIVGWSILKKLFGGGSSSTPVVTSQKTLARHGVGKRRQSRKYATIEKPNITPSGEFKGALDLLENTDGSIFLTGRAGTGKSTLLRYFRATTKKNIVVLAPTGVAAVNVQGQTIHSFFKFGPGITEDQVKKKYGRGTEIYKKLDAIVIDEISMVRADLFDCVERFLRLNGPDPEALFGGVQMILIGDLYQLPPVVTNEDRVIFEEHYKSPFFFDAKCLENADFDVVELIHVYRQQDKNFIEILDAIRLSVATDAQITEINKRVLEGTDSKSSDFHISLVPTNAMARDINNEELSRIKKSEKMYEGVINGDFLERNIPTERQLVLKEGAQVMLLNNDPRGEWVNGDLAQILKLSSTSIRVLFEDGTFDDVARYKWDRIRFVYDEEEGKIKSEVVGSFTQFPMRLAWAVTIHKGQGKTFDRIVVDFGSGTFAPGQAYVALSRCRSLEGLVLKSPLRSEYIFTDTRIKKFMDTL